MFGSNLRSLLMIPRFGTYCEEYYQSALFGLYSNPINKDNGLVMLQVPNLCLKRTQPHLNFCMVIQSLPSMTVTITFMPEIHSFSASASIPTMIASKVVA